MDRTKCVCNLAKAMGKTINGWLRGFFPLTLFVMVVIFPGVRSKRHVVDHHVYVVPMFIAVRRVRFRDALFVHLMNLLKEVASPLLHVGNCFHLEGELSTRYVCRRRFRHAVQREAVGNLWDNSVRWYSIQGTLLPVKRYLWRVGSHLEDLCNRNNVSVRVVYDEFREGVLLTLRANVFAFGVNNSILRCNENCKWVRLVWLRNSTNGIFVVCFRQLLFAQVNHDCFR